MDRHTREQRSRNMAAIKGKNTKPEIMVMKELKRRKIYFKSHCKEIKGTPDIVFKRKKIAIFIDSDFWHCNPKKFIAPKTNIEFWDKKIKRNIERDKEVNKYLLDSGWRILRIWESDIYKNLDECINNIIDLKRE